jgi:UrcA family protein
MLPRRSPKPKEIYAGCEWLHIQNHAADEIVRYAPAGSSEGVWKGAFIMLHVHNGRAKFFLGLALVGLINAAGTATARANDRQSDSIPVAARDLDLRTRTGAAMLRHRVVIAAYKVCEATNPGDQIDSDAFSACVREAVQHASQQVETLIAAAGGGSVIASAAGPSR